MPIVAPEEVLIEGLKLHVTEGELRTHLVKLAAEHAAKADGYASQRSGLQELRGAVASGYSNDPAASLAMSEREHRTKAAYYAFVEGHLIPKATYVLTERDLRELGITGDPRW